MQPNFLNPDKLYTGYLLLLTTFDYLIKLRRAMKNVSVTYVYKASQNFHAHLLNVVQKPNFNCDTKCIEV